MLQLIIMFFMFFNSFLFTQTNHPMSMGIILLFQTVLTSIFTGMISKSFWFSYILFLVFVGGMLILFMYMSALASNELINFSLKPFIKFIIMMNLLFLLILCIDKFYMINWMLNKELDMYNMTILTQENTYSLVKMYNTPNNFITILLISYLLLTLIMVVKITSAFNGPLRPKSL